MYCELHNHLYGSLTAERLYTIGKRNPNPRWNIFTDSYEKAYGRIIEPSKFFEEYDTLEKFSKLYYFNHRGPFPEFQAKFNLIIALVPFTIDEMKNLTEQIVLDHARENVSHTEYRIMFPPNEERDIFERRIQAICCGLEEGEALALKEGLNIRSEAILSLHRNQNTIENYNWLKELMAKDSLVNDRLTGIDFCHIEEGFPPKEKEDFFNRVLSDNKQSPNSALAIVYHVAESYEDKTPFSASRWVWESVRNGAHRLGHCIALGLDPNYFANSIRKESTKERVDQLNWELTHYEEITRFGEYYSRQEIEKNLKECHHSPLSNQNVKIHIDEISIRYLRTLQDYILNFVKESNSVIESCPSSNFYIGMIHNAKEHPLKRFVENKVKVTIGSDDPGIFDTNLQKEYTMAKEIGLSEQEIETIRTKSFLYTSALLSGRTKSS